MQSKFPRSWTSWSSRLGKLFTAHLFMERDWARSGGGDRRGPGSPALGSRLRGTQAARQANACPRGNSPCDLPAAEPRAYEPWAALEAVFLRAQKLLSCQSRDTCISAGPKHLVKMRWVDPLAPSRADGTDERPAWSWAGFPPPLAPFAERIGEHLQVGGEDTEVGGQLREPQVRAVHLEQHPAVGLALTARGAPPKERARPRRAGLGRQLQQDRQGQERGDRGCVHGAREGAASSTRSEKSFRMAADGGARDAARWASAARGAALLPPGESRRRSAAGPRRARCSHAGLRSGAGYRRCRNSEPRCCPRPARCGAASPLARLCFKALQPELRAQ